MALPWQNDFCQCADRWWPVPRPNFVTRQGAAGLPFTAGVVTSGETMVDNWHRLGFVVRQGSQFVEVDRCDLRTINLLTPTLDFQDVPQGPIGMVREAALAITFEVSSPSSPSPSSTPPAGGPCIRSWLRSTPGQRLTHGPERRRHARLWVIYRTSTPGDVLLPRR